MLCFAVIGWTTPSEFDIREIRHADKQNSGKGKIC